jgi:hypothetical protein
VTSLRHVQEEFVAWKDDCADTSDRMPALETAVASRAAVAAARSTSRSVTQGQKALAA